MIWLQEGLQLENVENVTISGITAAPGGVELRGVVDAPMPFVLRVDNSAHVVIRFLRIRCADLKCVVCAPVCGRAADALRCAGPSRKAWKLRTRTT